MTHTETAKKLLSELPAKDSCTSMHGVDKTDALKLRACLSKAAAKLGYTVFTKLRGREFIVWRVE